jgi:hypothetical protein
MEVTYLVKSAGKVIEKHTDLTGDSVQFFSGQRVVVIGRIPLTAIAPGKYTLEVQVLDKVSNRSLTAQTEFKVNEPPKAVASQ